LILTIDTYLYTSLAKIVDIAKAKVARCATAVQLISFIVVAVAGGSALLVILRFAAVFNRSMSAFSAAIGEWKAGNLTARSGSAGKDELSHYMILALALVLTATRLAYVARYYLLRAPETPGFSMLLVALAGAAIGEISARLGKEAAGAAESAALSRKVHDGAFSLDGAVDAQAVLVAESSTSVEQMIASVRSVAESTERVGRSYGSLLVAADEGTVRLDEVGKLVRGVIEKLKLLGETNAMITGIASKTNLLAMNAAIEAAHAGDAAAQLRSSSAEMASGSGLVLERMEALVRMAGITSIGSEAIAESSAGTEEGFDAVKGLIKNTDEASGRLDSVTARFKL